MTATVLIARIAFWTVLAGFFLSVCPHVVLSYVSVRVAGFSSVLFGCECVVVRFFVVWFKH